MSITKAYDVSHVRFTAPDIERMRSFLLDFGMVEVARDDDTLAMRGHGDGPFCHITERGDPGFKSFGIWMRERHELEALAAHDGVEIKPYDAPGGGEFIELVDPDGYCVEVISGHRPAEPLQTDQHRLWNHAGEYPRQNSPRRVKKGSSHVKRLGHIVLGVSDFKTSEAWYKERFGLITSDEIQMSPEAPIGAFMRCDRGEEPCDHHTIFLMQRPIPPSFMHAAFEVQDIDDLMAGHDHLKTKGYTAQWGVGRHILGSQIFDYWLDPWGHEVEHWTDGDQLTAAAGGGVGSIEELIGVQWGMEIPPLPGSAGE